MGNREVLRGQKLLGWVLILGGLSLLMLVGLAQALVARYSLPYLEAFASWAPGAWDNRTVVGLVAWLLLAAGYVFLLTALLEERLRELEGRLEARLRRVAREVAPAVLAEPTRRYKGHEDLTKNFWTGREPRD